MNSYDLQCFNNIFSYYFEEKRLDLYLLHKRDVNAKKLIDLMGRFVKLAQVSLIVGNEKKCLFFLLLANCVKKNCERRYRWY